MPNIEDDNVDRWIIREKSRFVGEIGFSVIGYLHDQIRSMILLNGCENILNDGLSIKLYWIGTTNTKEKQERYYEVSIVQTCDPSQILCKEYMQANLLIDNDKFTTKTS